MYSRKVFEKDSVERDNYTQRMLYSFPKLSNDIFYRGTDIGLFYNNELIGGVTLKFVDNIKNDPDLSRYWDIKNPIAGTRISRLWISTHFSKKALPHLFNTIIEVAEKNTFFYGILSLPLKFSKEKEYLFSSHKGWLFPKLALEKCEWPLDKAPVSEGRKLLRTYMHLGADFLGPLSGSNKDLSIKIAMGMDSRKIDRTVIIHSHE